MLARSFLRGVVAALILSAASLAMAQTASYLPAGGFLAVGQYLVSPNHRVIAVQQGDGNFCVYAAGTPSAATSQNFAWCHMSHGAIGNYFTIIQTDGNLCTYRGTSPNDNHGMTWCSMAYGPVGPHWMVLNNDGDLCTHKGNGPNDDWGTLWCTMAGGTPAATPGIIDVSQSLAATFNNDANAWRSVAQAIGAPNPELWYIESMKVTKLDNTGFNPSAIQANSVMVGSQQAVNCTPLTMTQDVTVSEEVTNSLSISKSTTFDASVSATVSYSGLFWSGSVTATTSTSTTNGSDNTTSNTATLSKTVSVPFPPNSGAVLVLSATRRVGNNVPWSATFVPTDDQTVAVVARRMGRNDRVNGTLQWIQVKSYLPADKRALALTGTLTVDSTDVKSAASTLYSMTPDQVKQVCSTSGSAPIMMPGTQMNVVTGNSVQGLSRSPVPAVAPGSKLVTRKLSAAETAAMIRNLRPSP